MTALIVIREPAAKAVHLISDGACWDREGRMSARDTKVVTLPHLNAAVAARGSRAALLFVAAGLSFRAATFDQLKANAGTLLQALLADFAPIYLQTSYARNYEPDFEMVVAGINGSEEPDSFLVSNHSKYCSPFIPVDLSDFAMLPGTPEAVAAATAAPFELRADGRMDVTALAARTMGLQRSMGMELRPGIVVPFAAGFIQVTSVSAHKVETSVVHRWADEVGEFVGVKLDLSAPQA